MKKNIDFSAQVQGPRSKKDHLVPCIVILLSISLLFFFSLDLGSFWGPPIGLATGTVIIKSNPGDAFLYVDGIPKGKASSERELDLESGEHTIKVGGKGYFMQTQKVMVVADTSKEIVFDLGTCLTCKVADRTPDRMPPETTSTVVQTTTTFAQTTSTGAPTTTIPQDELPDTRMSGGQADGEALLMELKERSGEGLRISRDPRTDKIRSVGMGRGEDIATSGGMGGREASGDGTVEENAREFLSSYGSLFGLDDESELETMRKRTLTDGRSFIRFQQEKGGVPVFGGEMIVQENGLKNIVSAAGELLPGAAPDTQPKVTSAQAKGIALEYAVKKHGVDISYLRASEPELWIYSPELMGFSSQASWLTWKVEVSSEELIHIDEILLIDAKEGFQRLMYNRVDYARVRYVYDHENNLSLSVVPGTANELARSEGESAVGQTDIDDAYELAGDTYDFYADVHGRDSLDDAGMNISSAVRYCHWYYGCPMVNAFWSPTDQSMAFGDGFASADDVMAHELTHGVTSYESNLVYSYQSGAINEAFSDIWGEFVDLTNGFGNDTASARWMMGEDLPPSIGVIRNMADPTIYGHPDKVTSSYYECGSSDNGGVHTNNGVGNKAAYLMVDGGTFNGYTIDGLGINRTAALFYEAQTNLLTSTAGWSDLRTAILQAAVDLSYNSSDQLNIEKAVNATEMHLTPCVPQPVGECTAKSPYHLFFDGFEDTNSGYWTHAAIVTSDVWSYSTEDPQSGTYSLHGDDISSISDSYMAMTSSVSLPTESAAYMTFNHSYGLEEGYDGGVVEYSINGGSNWTDAGSLITNNGYTDTLSSSYNNPLAARDAFSGSEPDYMTTKLNLTSLGGEDLLFRFRVGTDSSIGSTGWFIDNVKVYTCNAPPNLANPTLTPSIGSNSTLFNYTITYDDADADAPSYVWVIINGVGKVMKNLSDDWAGGEKFYYNTTLDGGIYGYSFEASDGEYTDQTASYAGPNVYCPDPLCDGISPGSGSWDISTYTACEDQAFIHNGPVDIQAGKVLNLTLSNAFINSTQVQLDGTLLFQGSTLSFVQD